MRVVLATLVLLGVAWSPVLFPGGWVRDGFVPDAAVLVVTYVALRAGAERAAVVGMGLGLAASAFSAEPAGLHMLLLGGLGYALGLADRTLYRERALVQVLLAAFGVGAVRIGGRLLTGALLPVDAVLGGGSDRLAAASGLPDWTAGIVAACTAALVTGAVAPAFFRLLRVTAVLRPVEPRLPLADVRTRVTGRV